MYAKYNIRDNAIANLDLGISASTTTITVGTGQGSAFPEANFILKIVQYTTPADPSTPIIKFENILVTNRSGDTLTVTRGFDGDTPTSFDAGDFLYLTNHSAIIEDIQEEVTSLGTRTTYNETDITNLENNKEDKSNKKTDFSIIDDIGYPTIKAIVDYIADLGFDIIGLPDIGEPSVYDIVPIYDNSDGVNKRTSIRNIQKVINKKHIEQIDITPVTSPFTQIITHNLGRPIEEINFTGLSSEDSFTARGTWTTGGQGYIYGGTSAVGNGGGTDALGAVTGDNGKVYKITVQTSTLNDVTLLFTQSATGTVSGITTSCIFEIN